MMFRRLFAMACMITSAWIVPEEYRRLVAAVLLGAVGFGITVVHLFKYDDD